ncbi:hypothetical protein [Myceligenerans pegani]|uniref:Uncharacterized protein n=1 Tax=Myceligenerans pegani TaxID=2776917 RepID=A0ABR9N1Y7_9MICO|nr:hypothetical protein [Myceligenerans sp. TRM 65318]MBE1877665.1 hypothetical protein [Myceligenerans sp. TRM 65318]MBE3019936.1 hypothetical protein [Myceligenerans sp. TRM 65318]
MRIITTGRVAALALSVATFAFLFIHDSWRPDNLFLVPDLVLCVTLVAAALTPARWASRALLFAFGLTAGVLMTSVASYAVDGRFGGASLLGAVAAVVLAALIARSGPAAMTGPAATTGPGATE